MISATARLALGYGSMLRHAVTQRQLLREQSVRDALVRQIQVTGVQAVPYVAVVALLFGAVVVTRVTELIGPDDDTVLKAVVWGGVRELGPMVTALIIIVRSSVSMAAEVALFQLRSGIQDSHWTGIIHEEEVVLPRLIGTALSGAALVTCFQFIAVGSALVSSALTLGSSIEFELDNFLTTASWSQVPLSIGKGFLFGAGIAAVSCYHGLQVSGAIGGVPKAVVSAALASLSFVLVVDALAALLRLA